MRTSEAENHQLDMDGSNRPFDQAKNLEEVVNFAPVGAQGPKEAKTEGR